jgi:DNA-directed RNA polymerase
MEVMRRKFIKATRDDMKKSLPDVAQQQAKVVYQEVKKLFDSYDNEVSERMNEDIQSRQTELDQLVEQKEKGEFQREAEIKRLKNLEDNVYSEWQGLESAYERLINAKS